MSKYIVLAVALNVVACSESGSAKLDGPPDSGVLCSTLSEVDCPRWPHCELTAGFPASAPAERVFTGCRTPEYINGEKVLTTTAVTCAREAPGAECYLFSNNSNPDGWERYDCSNMPADCGVEPGSRHPSY